MAKINSTLFQAAATIYQALLEAPTNRVPDSPEHAHRAKRIAEALYEAANKDPIVTAAAARTLCGFLVNQVSGHCTEPELIAWSVTGVRNLVDAFSRPLPVVPAQMQVQAPVFSNPIPPPQMPPSPAPVPPTPVYAPPPVAPLDVPGFEEVGR